MFCLTKSFGLQKLKYNFEILVKENYFKATATVYTQHFKTLKWNENITNNTKKIKLLKIITSIQFNGSS